MSRSALKEGKGTNKTTDLALSRNMLARKLQSPFHPIFVIQSTTASPVRKDRAILARFVRSLREPRSSMDAFREARPEINDYAVSSRVPRDGGLSGPNSCARCSSQKGPSLYYHQPRSAIINPEPISTYQSVVSAARPARILGLILSVSKRL